MTVFRDLISNLIMYIYRELILMVLSYKSTGSITLNKPNTEYDQQPLNTKSEIPAAQETVLTALDTWITPTDRFYIRNHFTETPTLEPTSVELIIDGEVGSPLSLNYQEILKMPATESAVTLECAGNSRSYANPPAEGIQFEHGAVGNAVWKGVPLKDLLITAGLKPSATEILFTGADNGEEEEEGETLQVQYQRSLPVSEALRPLTLVAYEMNGESLSQSHGSPLRLIVPNWYGMASVKWLEKITAIVKPFDGFFQSRRYVHIGEGISHRTEWTPVERIQVKSLVTSPRHGHVIRSKEYSIQGVAWSGEGDIVKVEISTDGERTWSAADLQPNDTSAAWHQWTFPFCDFKPGHYIISARAYDDAGNTQPPSIPWNFRGYANNSIHSIAIEVGSMEA
jgi:DMSO/TMAO reductase YedYZ molybdopterin-dependent catalytic subunit